MTSRVHPDDVQLESWTRQRIKEILQAEIDGTATDNDVVVRIELQGALTTMSRVSHDSKLYKLSRARVERVQQNNFDYYVGHPKARRFAASLRSR